MEAQIAGIVGSEATQVQETAHPLDPLFRSIFDGTGQQGRSDSAFQAVADGIATYGKAKPSKWDFDAETAKQSGTRTAPVLSKAERKDKRQNCSWVRDFVPVTRQPDYGILAKQGNRVAGSLSSHTKPRITVEKLNRTTGEVETMRFRIQFNTISILSYGKFFEFRTSDRSSGTFRDGRDGKSKPLSFAKSELRRLLGATEGDLKFAELTKPFAAKPPRNPATLQPVTPTSPKSSQNDTVGQSGTVTGLQGRKSLTLWESRKAAATAGRANKRDERNWTDVNSVISLAEVAPRS